MRSPCLIPVPAQKHLFERLTEHFVEYRVKYRIDHRTRVSQPRDELIHPVVDTFFAFAAYRRKQIENEKRRPQDHEREEHYTQHFCGLLFQTDDAPVTGRVSGNDAGVPAVVRANAAAVARVVVIVSVTIFFVKNFVCFYRPS